MLTSFLTYYWHFFILGLSSRVILLVELAVIGGIVGARLGDAYGLPRLFWHENWKKQGVAGIHVTLLVAKILYISYLIEISIGSAGGRWDAILPADVHLYSGKGIGVYLLYGAASILFTGLLIWAFAAILRVTSGHTHRRDTPVTSRAPVIAVDRRWPFVAGVLAAALFVAGLLWCNDWIITFSYAHPAMNDQLVKWWVAPSWDTDAAPMHLAAALVVTGMVIEFVLLGKMDSVDSWASPAIGLCLLMGLGAAGVGAITARLNHPTLVVLAFAILLIIGGIPRYKIRIPGFEGLYTDQKAAEIYPVIQPIRHPDPAADGSPVDCPETGHVLWRPDGRDQKYPLIFVCVSGGGIRAAVWSAEVLAKLEHAIPEHFPHHVRLVTGASGGIVGAAYYVRTLQDPTAQPPPEHRHGILLGDLVKDLSRDSLSPTAHHFFFRDLPMNFLPINLGADRGQVLDRAWIKNSQGRFGGSFASLRDGEMQGWRPSLLITPMLVEDGRRLFITNLELEHLTYGQGPRVCRNEPPKPPAQISGAANVATPAAATPGGPASGNVFYSRSAYLCSKLFPDAWEDLKVVTAARLSASFPLVTPAPLLPTTPRRRVVDAGYFDNYGVSMAANWLEDTLNDPKRLAWLKANVSKILIVQVRDGVSALAQESRQLGDDPPSTAPARSHEEFSSPITALMAARESVAMFRNDEKLEWLAKLVDSRGLGQSFFSTALFQFTGEASLSWYLPQAECDAIRKEVDSDSVRDAVGRVKEWLAPPLPPVLQGERARGAFEPRSASASAEAPSP